MPFFTILATLLAVTSGVVSYIQAKKAQKAAKRANDEQRGVLVNKESNIEQIPVIYGERRVGGTRVFVSTEGKLIVGGANDGRWNSGWDTDTEGYTEVTDTPTNEYLFIALVLAEGEVESITDIWVDDIPISDAKYSGLIDYDVYLGTDNQLMSDTDYLRQVNEYWTEDHRLRGVAFLGMRFKWDENAFSGIPEITALVKGRKVYDPRTATTAWSDNPALCIRDYLTNTRYGKGLPSSAIDDTAIGDAADDCDESVTEYSGGTTGKLFTCNAVLDTSKTLFDNLNILLLGCRGFLPYSQGKYRLKIDGSKSSSFTFTNDTIIDGIEIKGETKEDKYNRVTVKFPNPDANWQPDTAIWPPAGSTEESTYLAEDGGVLLHEEIELDTITNYYQARDLARVILLRSRNAITCGIKTTSEALQLEVADVVSITHSTPGWTAKPFQVVGMQLNDDGTVGLALLEYDSSIYTWEVGAQQTSYPDTYLPNPFTVGTISNITVTESTTLGDDGTVIPMGVIEWDASYDTFVSNYEIQYKLTSEADTEYKSIFTSINKYQFFNAVVGTSFTVRIRAINTLGSKGAFTTATFTINGDQTAPNAPTGLSATGGIANIRLDWTNPSAKDLKGIDVYRYTSNNSASASKIGSITGESFVDQNIAASTTYYYWIKAFDYSGNVSAFSSVASSTSLATPTDGDPGADGPRSAFVYFYYNTAQSSTPTAPTTAQVSYNFSTGAASISASGWSTSFNPAAVSNDNTGENIYWAVSVTFQEVTYGGTVSKNIVGPFKWTNYDGLVTFTNLANATNENGTGTTFIDGGAITADSITVSKLSASSDTISSGLLFGLGQGASISGVSAAGVFETSTSGSVAAIIASRSAAVALGAGNTGTSGGSYAVVGYGGLSYSAGNYSSATTVGTLGVGTAGGYFSHSSGPQTTLCTSSYSADFTDDVYCAGSYLPFTGSHEAVISKSESIQPGDILVDLSVISTVGVSDVITEVAISSSPNQSSVIGVYKEDASVDHIPVTLADMSLVENEVGVSRMEKTIKDKFSTLFDTHKVVHINAVGEGKINVCGENGDIQAGDLIVTSNVPGKGMKQTDDIIRSCTVAKAREAAIFYQGETKQIACIYLCG